MTLVAYYDLELHQMNFKTVFLNGDIEEMIYMVQIKKKKIHLWFKAGIPSMVLEVWSSDYLV